MCLNASGAVAVLWARHRHVQNNGAVVETVWKFSPNVPPNSPRSSATSPPPTIPDPACSMRTKKCPRGIVSRKISEVLTKRERGQVGRESLDIAKYVVPAPTLAEFLASKLHF